MLLGESRSGRAAEHQELRLEPLCGEEDGEEARGNMIGLFYLIIAAAVHVAGRAAQIPFARFLAFATGEQQ